MEIDHEFTVRNNHSMRTSNGVAWSADLCFRGLQVATVENQGNGGCTTFRWSTDALGVEAKKNLDALVATLPPVTFEGLGTFPVDAEAFVAELCDRSEQARVEFNAAKSAYAKRTIEKRIATVGDVLPAAYALYSRENRDCVQIGFGTQEGRPCVRLIVEGVSVLETIADDYAAALGGLLEKINHACGVKA